MPLYHLLEQPRVIPGGVSFTINELQHGQTVFVTDAALSALAPDASELAERLTFVMTNISRLAECALSKSDGQRVAELIVLGEPDVRSQAVSPG